MLELTRSQTETTWIACLSKRWSTFRTRFFTTYAGSNDIMFFDWIFCIS